MWNACGLALLILSAADFVVEVVANREILIARQANSTTPNFTFLNDSLIQPVSCQSVRISWFYEGPEATIDLYVTNVNVSQALPAPSSSSSTPSASRPTSRRPRPTDTIDNSTIVTKTVGTSIDADTFDFVWSPVDVPQGWYIFNASMPAESYSSVSSPFYVHIGSNISCLSSDSPPTTNSSSFVPTTSSVPKVTSSDSSQGDGSHSDSMPLGAILGASLGGFALLVVLVVCYFWCAKRRHATRSRGGSNYPSSSHHWKLGSADSGDKLRKVEPRSHVANDSLGTVICSDEAAGVEKSSIHSKMDATVLTYEPESTLAALPVLIHATHKRSSVIDRPRSTTSLTSKNLPLDDNAPSPRRALVLHASRHSMDSMTYPPTSPAVTPLRNSILIPTQHASPPPSTTTHDESATVRPLAPMTPDAAKNANRQSMGRKRKPVPIYDENEDIPSSAPISALPSSPTEVVLASSPPPNNVGHYITRNQSTQDFRPELTHKNSFGPGVKPLHYIIPDMPLPPR